MEALAQPQGNLLFYTAAFAYAPVYIVSLLQLTCTFRVHAPQQPTQLMASEGDNKKTR
jgi:hypothetical protein